MQVQPIEIGRGQFMCLCFLKGKINESLKNIGLENI